MKTRFARALLKKQLNTRGNNTILGHTSTFKQNAPTALLSSKARYASTANLPEGEPVVYHDDLITTENIMKQMEELLSDEELSNYKTKHEMTFDEFEQKFNQQMEKPVYYDDEYIDFISKSLDFPREEVLEIVQGKKPQFYKLNEKDELEVDWQEFSRHFQRTETEKSLVPEIERQFKEMKQYKNELEEGTGNEVKIDWESWKSKLGANTVDKIRRDLTKVIEKTEPKIDFKQVEEKLDEQFQPILDRLKDDLIDNYPMVEEMTEDLVRETPLMKKDENGLYPHFASPGFMDKYFPKERDEVIQEIDDDEWDYEYLQQYKALKLNPDEILSRNKDWITKESSRIEEEEYRALSSKTATLSSKKREEQDLYYSVIDGSRHSKELESEVNQLKLVSETMEEGKEGEKEKKDDKLSLNEDEWWNFLEKNYGVTKDMKQTRDFQHFESEAKLKEWEETGEKERIEAEQTFFNTERESS